MSVEADERAIRAGIESLLAAVNLQDFEAVLGR